ncbi:MAG TPA: hypothetical protein PKA28_12530 [Methylomusa anaerophila]|uniref:HD domain-containing protein n=1 Tax=Methylomusa anaerophila TaxID=1930071 RepID=A0A348AF51_9FIRM|nr:hypothetical protein [Methylomusa anaerophila]BBB89699.1 hypothetical protein MAMMFC1_00332 [Methylomusa anaerophila]HML89257.1 hypothetical protein [Methylomusa anaerophila]
MVNLDKLLEFASPFYSNKDEMHNLSHIYRMIKAAQSLMKYYKGQVNGDLIIYGSYFHGLIDCQEEPIREYLASRGIPPEQVDKIVQVSWESKKDQIPNSLEGKILHDAHLIEGGKTYLIVKSLITGTVRGQSLEQTIKYIEKNILGKASCFLPEAQSIYSEKEGFARQFLDDLQAGL